jgi:DNA-binding CsgD family transcriptional regulator
VRAMKAGAVDFLEKPVRRETLFDALQQALARDAAQRAHRAEARRHEQRLAVLTAREREVFERVVAGRLNKQIADELGISLHTVKAHRALLMEKLGVVSAVERGRFFCGAGLRVGWQIARRSQPGQYSGCSRKVMLCHPASATKAAFAFGAAASSRSGRTCIPFAEPVGCRPKVT